MIEEASERKKLLTFKHKIRHPATSRLFCKFCLELLILQKLISTSILVIMLFRSFTDLCENLETDKAKLVATHPLFLEMATGEMKLSRFFRLIQQDHLYLKSDYPNFAIMADKEVDPGRKEILSKWSSPGSSMKLIESYFPQFQIPAAEAEEFTKEYIAFKRNAALDSSVEVSLSTHYACWILWSKAGIEMDKIAKYENNKYSRFVKALSDKGTSSTDARKMVLNGYYERASEAEREMMLKNYQRTVQMELDFCNGVYKL